MREITCHCGHTFTAELPDLIDPVQLPGIYREIIDGDFMCFTCPECGTELDIELEFIISDSSSGFELHFFPEIKRSSVLDGSVSSSRKRIAVGYRELVEKILISGASLDDRVIELLKLRLLEKAGNTDNISIYYHEKDAGYLLFHVLGLRKGETGITRIPLEAYRRLEEKLESGALDPEENQIIEGPYISVTKVYLED